MRSDMLFQVTQCCEEFYTAGSFAIESVTAVQSLVSSQSVQGVEGFFTTILIAFKRFYLCVNSYVDFKTVRC